MIDSFITMITLVSFIKEHHENHIFIEHFIT